MMHSTSSRKPSKPTRLQRLALISLCVTCEVADYQSVVQRLSDKLMATPLMSSSSKAPAAGNN